MTHPSPGSTRTERASTHQRRRMLGTSTLAVAAAVCAALLPLVAPADAAEARSPQTVVSLTFDDGSASQAQAAAILDRYNLDGTFYITSGFVDGPDYLTRDQVATLARFGHEIGGHTTNHADLAAIDPAEAKRQICTDRATLTSWGYSLRSFAYPYASISPAAKAAVRECGYNSARSLGDLHSRVYPESDVYAESVRPDDPYETKALDELDSTWSLSDMQQSVTDAERRGGGWVQFTFHTVCASGCGELNVTPDTLERFARWLDDKDTTNGRRPSSQKGGTIVRTVGDVIGGTASRVVSASAPAAAAPGVNGVLNAGFEALGADGAPSCWMAGGWGTNTASFATGGTVHSGSSATTVSVSDYQSGDAKFLQRFDLGQCSPTVVTGHTYSLRAWYTATDATQFAVYLRNTTGTWQYWTSSPWFAATDTFAQAEWTTPAIPDGFSGISFGLSVFSDATLVSDDYELYDSVGAPAIASVVAPADPEAPVIIGEPAPVPTDDVETLNPVAPDADPAPQTDAPTAPVETIESDVRNRRDRHGSHGSDRSDHSSRSGSTRR